MADPNDEGASLSHDDLSSVFDKLILGDNCQQRPPPVQTSSRVMPLMPPTPPLSDIAPTFITPNSSTPLRLLPAINRAGTRPTMRAEEVSGVN